MKALSPSLRAASRDAGVVGLVDQHAGQRVGVELDEPAAVRARRARRRRAPGPRPAAPPKARPGFGSRRADLGEHVGEILVVDAAEALQRREDRAWRRGRVARPAPAWPGRSGRARAAGWRGIRRGRGRRCPAGSKLCTRREHALDARRPRAEPLGDVVDGLAEIAGLVDGIDEVAADQAARRDRAVARSSCALEMLVQASTSRGQRRLEVGRRPRRSRRRRCRPGRRRSAAATVAAPPAWRAGDAGSRPGRRCRDRCRARASIAVAAAGLERRSSSGVGRRRGSSAPAPRAGRAVASALVRRSSSGLRSSSAST